MFSTRKEKAIAQAERLIAEEEEQARAEYDFATRAESVRGRAISHNRIITVDVDANGWLVALTVGNDALASGGAALAQEILQLTQVARSDAAQQVRALAIEVFGEDSDWISVLGLD